MKMSGLRTALNREPFRPFQIHLTNGEIFAVEHPENMSLPQAEEDVFLVWKPDHWNLVEAAEVARVSVKRRAVK